MKKSIIVCPVKDFKSESVDSGQIIASRSGSTIWITNIQCNPERVLISQSPEGDEFIIRVKMRDGDFVIIQDEKGVGEKRSLK